MRRLLVAEFNHLSKDRLPASLSRWEFSLCLCGAPRLDVDWDIARRLEVPVAAYKCDATPRVSRTSGEKSLYIVDVLLCDVMVVHTDQPDFLLLGRDLRRDNSAKGQFKGLGYGDSLWHQ